MAPATFRNDSGSTFWTSAEAPPFLNHVSHENDNNAVSSSSEGQEDCDDGSGSDDDGAGGTSLDFDALSELEAALISQLEEIPDFSQRDEMVAMSSLDDSTSTTVAPSPMSSTSSTLVIKAPASPSIPGHPLVKANTVSERQRGLAEDKEVGQSATKLLRRSTLDQEQVTSLLAGNNTIPAAVPWRDLPRPKDCVRLRRRTDTPTFQNTVNPSTHKPTETNALWSSTLISAPSLSPLQTSSDQYIQYPIAPQPALPTAHKPLLPVHTVPHTTYTHTPALGIEGTGIFHPQNQYSFHLPQAVSPNTNYSYPMPPPAYGAGTPYPSTSSTDVPAATNSPQFVVGSSCPPTFVRLPLFTEVCSWDLGHGQPCGHRFTNSEETENHIRVHVNEAREAAGSDRPKKLTDVWCQWSTCRKLVLGTSLKRHIFDTHLGAGRVRCTLCTTELRRKEGFRRHQTRCKGTGSLPSTRRR